MIKLKIQFIFHSNETWWDCFSDHLLYPLVNNFWKLKPNTQLGAQTSSKDNKALQSWCSSIVNCKPLSRNKSENQDESLVSVGNTNPNFDPKILTKKLMSPAHLQSSFQLDGDLCFFDPLPHHICASRISEPEMKGVIKGNRVWLTGTKVCCHGIQEPSKLEDGCFKKKCGTKLGYVNCF